MSDVLKVEFGDPDKLLEQQAHAARGGLFLPVPDPAPEPLQSLHVVLVLSDGTRAELDTQVVQVLPGHGLALTFADASAANEALQPLFDAAVLADDDTDGDTVTSWGDDELAEIDEDIEDESDPQTLLDKIRSMSATEKMKLAKHGDRASRLLLIKDPNKTIHTFLVQNKRITLDEIRYLAGFRQANPEALKMIAENRIWMQNSRIVTALVRNPKTPSTLAVKLLDRLPITELRRIARSSDIPRAVSQAAKRKVLK